jgi:DNA topoisomerase I
MPRLRRSDCAAPGIARRRRGRGFEYRDPDGERIDDPETLERIAELGIPPAWRDAWICLDPQGHLQATGVDAAGRKQYLYHERWRAHRDRLKFDSMVLFGQALPRLRRRVSRDLRAPGGGATPLPVAELGRERVLACATRLLDVGLFRIGSEDYAEQNDSYGLSTLRREHVSVQDGAVLFDFPAKSGQQRIQEVHDRDVLRVIAALRRRRSGEQLLAWRQHGWTELDADDVNAYIKRHAGEEFSAKDFRTWSGTVLAAVELAAIEQRGEKVSRKRAVSATIKSVAEQLGNTPAVCRASYVDPRVIDRYSDGVTIASMLDELPASGGRVATSRSRARIEAAVVELLDEAG